ncbi:DUF1700 domain-containing protein [Candidatus Soleaferrea massiliensis]|uniref:DUF1700 domain-containing protein n=1 Tax=Candidatus Soleaferrea massiliensis TaxID=1470354 RepID=UPI0006934B8D|nr:DUF1700 domain-containing protein [Candidatus Soleaferrea massiliensis]
MNKEEYLLKLEAYLKKQLSREEVDDILRDYGEYFEDGRRRNKTDLEISAKLGDPQVIAEQFLEEYREEKKTKAFRNTMEIEAVKRTAQKGAKTVAKGAHAAADGIGRGIHGISEGVDALKKKEWKFHPIQRLKRILKSLLKACGYVLLIGLLAILTFFLVCLFGFLAVTAAAFILGGLGGMIAAAATLGFVSLYFSFAVFFLCIALICLGGLLGIFIYCCSRRLIRFGKAQYKNHFQKTVAKEVYTR